MEDKCKKKSPKNCYWYEQCKCIKICEYYTPLVEDEEVFERRSQLKKREYRKEFYEYMKENDIYEEE